MPSLVIEDGINRKRKRVSQPGEGAAHNLRKAPKSTSKKVAGTRILFLEEQILDSREHYNNIVELQKLSNNADRNPKTSTLAAVALCRVFCRLIAGEKLVKRQNTSEADAQIVQWLKSRLKDYVDSLLNWIGSPDASRESTALTLLMRIVKEQASGGSKGAEQSWSNQKSTFRAVITRLLFCHAAEGARQEFVNKYVEEFDDIRFYSFVTLKHVVQQSSDELGLVVGNAVELLSQIEGVPESDEQLEDWFADTPPGDKHLLLSLNAHRKGGREAWLAIFGSRLSLDQRKKILNITSAQILPWFSGHIELLADFLTDSFNEGGSMSLMALSGIFDLMTQKNLDYPDFYGKLYSLLDEDLLHSKHRSRFFRLFETFMASTHLPAALTASFVKRLSRLALQAPPGAIVWIVPWTYNILRQHPPCTFMLHRTYHPAHTIYATHPRYEEEGMEDSFDMGQTDPMLTGAIDSSLWELETLRSHYHPNVATLTRIVGEQFTKREYQLEDFLDHSYTSLINAEIGKDMRKTPVVEWEIPKRILTSETGGMNEIGTMLQNVMSAE